MPRTTAQKTKVETETDKKPAVKATGKAADHLADPLDKGTLKDPLADKVAKGSDKLDTNAFSLAVSGEGALLDRFISKAFAFFAKRATLYDRSTQADAARQSEVDLYDSGVIDPAHGPSTEKTRADLANPPKTDVTVRFSRSGSTETVTVKVGKLSQTLTFETDSKTGSLDLWDGYVQQIVVTVDQLLAAARG